MVPKTRLRSVIAVHGSHPESVASLLQAVLAGNQLQGSVCRLQTIGINADEN